MTNPDREHWYKRNHDLIGANVDDEMVMMSVDHGQYYGLSAVGSRIWELIEEPRTYTELVDQILGEFEVERRVCERDLSEFLAKMEELGLVERT